MRATALVAAMVWAGALSGTAVHAQTPKPGGTFTMAIEAEPPSLDPAFQQSTLVTSLLDLTYDHLWRWNRDFTDFVPHVAESWKWIDDTHFKVNLKKGIKFHNGREIKAADAKYSIDRILDPNTASPSAAFLEPIQEVVVDDDYSFTIVLKHPWFGLQDKLAQYAPLVPKEAQADLKTKPVGSGPFVFESWTPGLEMTFTKNKDYWDTGKPYLDRVVIRFMPEYSTARNALTAGEIDLINWPDSADYDSLKADPNIDLHVYNVNAVMYIGINTKNDKLKDPKVRKAIALATSRDAYNDALYRGLGAVTTTPIPRSSPYYKASWEYGRDVEQAKKLLAEAGYADGFDIRILALKGSEQIMGEVLQADLADIGIRAEITISDIPVGLDAIFNKEDFDLCVLGDLISPDPDKFLSNYMVPDGGAAGATGRWDNAQVRDLIAKGRGTINPGERVKIYQEIYDTILDQTPMVFLAFPMRHPASRKYVQGWFASADIRYDWTTIWLDK
jgi:peptide/nickel transport system substrate-binding protein